MKNRPVPFLLVHGFELALTLALVIVGIIFTAFPAALEHAPIGFENRGILHHSFHYGLLVGAVLAFVGLIWSAPRTEMVGLILVAGAIAINLVALGTSGDENGIAYTFRGAALVGILLRLYLIAVFLPHFKHPE